MFVGGTWCGRTRPFSSGSSKSVIPRVEGWSTIRAVCANLTCSSGTYASDVFFVWLSEFGVSVVCDVNDGFFLFF